MLQCDFCGCSSPKYENGWVAHPDDDVSGAPGILLDRPPCAFAVLGYSLDAAVEHICFFPPQAPTSGDESGPLVVVRVGERVRLELQRPRPDQNRRTLLRRTLAPTTAGGDPRH